MSQNLSSVAVVIGALRVKYVSFIKVGLFLRLKMIYQTT